MEPDSVIENLNYLSDYLDEHRQRVRVLQEEIERMVRLPSLSIVSSFHYVELQRNDTSTKDELQTSNSRLRQLEDEKAALRKEVTALQGLLKVKQEDRDVVRDRVSAAFGLTPSTGSER
jgi:hypothetical protein